MGVVIKYQLEFPTAGLKVSNELFQGSFLLDADITVDMKRGKSASQFNIKLYDLPLNKAKKLTNQKIIISLGYFDLPFDKVLTGIVKEVNVSVNENQLITILKGQELGVYTLRENSFTNSLEDVVSIKEAIEKVLNTKDITKGEITNTPEIQNISGNLVDKTFSNYKLINILDDLARIAKAEFIVSDQKVWIGKPVQNNNYRPSPFKRGVNLAEFEPFDKEGESSDNLLKPLTVEKVEGFNFTIIGDPKLRPGNPVKADVDDFKQQDFIIHSLTHKFTQIGGYICTGCAFKPCTDGNCYEREGSLCRNSPDRVAETMERQNQKQQRRRPTIEIAKVESYKSGASSTEKKHVSSLYFGQNFDEEETQASINVEVKNNNKQIFRNKPIISQFAWHKCGLVTPVYSGMKALLCHNLNLQDDALVAGFIWSKTPEIKPPENKPGDWWLCLPIDFNSDNPPTDSTKAVNDLTANNGKRTIEVKSLKITVGSSQLKNVGKRPEEGEDDEFLIEHKSGTKIKIDSNGTLEIEAENISIRGNLTIEGNVEIQ
jgi:hypothetical protein